MRIGGQNAVQLGSTRQKSNAQINIHKFWNGSDKGTQSSTIRLWAHFYYPRQSANYIFCKIITYFVYTIVPTNV